MGTHLTDAVGRCLGVTRAGRRCANYTRNPSGYCEHHRHQAPDEDVTPSP